MALLRHRESGVQEEPLKKAVSAWVGSGKDQEPGNLPASIFPSAAVSQPTFADPVDRDQVVSAMPGLSGVHVTPSGDLETNGGRGKKGVSDLEGLGVHEVGHKVLQWLLEVLPLRSSPKGNMKGLSLFPLPTSRMSLSGAFPALNPLDLSWLISICVSLNSIWGCQLLCDKEVSLSQKGCLELLVKDVERLHRLTSKMERFDWGTFFSSRGIDYKGRRS